MKIQKLTEEYNKGEWVEVNLNTKKNGTPNIIPVKVDKELYHGKSFLGWAWGERQHEYPMSAIVNRIDGDDTTEIIKRYSLKEDINVDTVGDYITDHYDFDDIDDKYKSGISEVEPKVNLQGKSSHTFTKDKKWEVDFDEKGNILARTRQGKPSYFKGHINDKTNDFPSTDEDNIILAAKEQHGLKFGGLKEASYGGAFDIADDQYFTRDDIENAAEEVLNHINETFTEQYELGGTWFEDGKWIVNVKSIDGDWEFEELLPIDMRKIKEPWHLKREYAFDMASKFIDKIKLETQPITESLNEDTDTVAVEGPKEGPEAGLSSLINEAIQDELKTIDIYNSLAITARSEGYEDIAKMIDEINTEENKHVGQLQEALKSISPNAIAIEDGTAEGQEQLSNAVMFDDDLNDDELGIALFKLR